MKLNREPFQTMLDRVEIPDDVERFFAGLPEPLDVIVEGCTEVGGAYADKALGLWRIADLPHLPRMTG